MEAAHVPPGCIVVGVDATQATVRALDWAADEATYDGRHLLLVHGCGSPLMAGSAWIAPGTPDPLELYADLHAAGRGLLARAATRVLTAHPDLVVHQSLRTCDPRQAILEMSEEAAMVVVGSRGRGHVVSAALGSVSAEVAERSTVPVVVLRPHHGMSAGGGVLVAVDDGPQTAEVLRFAFHHARLRGRPVTVLRTTWDEVAATEAAHVVAVEEPEVAPVRRALEEAVEGAVAEHPDVSVTLTVGRGVPAECILTLADSMDLVVVGHHERGPVGRLVHGSVAVAVLEHASVPVAIVPLASRHRASSG